MDLGGHRNAQGSAFLQGNLPCPRELGPGVEGGRRFSAARARDPSCQGSWGPRASRSPCGGETGRLTEGPSLVWGRFPVPPRFCRGRNRRSPSSAVRPRLPWIHSYPSALQTTLFPEPHPRRPPRQRPIPSPTDLGKARPGRRRSLAGSCVGRARLRRLPGPAGSAASTRPAREPRAPRPHAL